jgi:hydroxymethylpyrimidine/phosphomethylpyrimidine kinase
MQADLKTFSALGCYGMSVLTALTAQNTRQVTAIHGIPPEFGAAQMDAIFSDIGMEAVKIGMLHHAAVVETVAEGLKRHAPPHIVLDPVMISTTGDRLLENSAVEEIRKRLLPLAEVLTPNLPEALVLLGRDPLSARNPSEEAMKEICRSLGDLGASAVLLKGGHTSGKESNDLLYCVDTNRYRIFKAPRIKTPNTHGTGCTLSSALAAGLARGFSLEEAAERAKTYISQALEAGKDYSLGKGHGPVHFFFDFWKNSNSFFPLKR